jgi:hypothetical protein
VARSLTTLLRSLAVFSVTAIPLVGAASSGCRSVANAEECDAVAKHLADLQVQKEQKPPLGQLASPLFDTPENRQRIFEEARKNAHDRCAKGWKKAVYDCMMESKDLATADKCRNL